MAETWRVSPWLSEVDSPAPPLLGEVDADVVIVGAGYTGLSAALELRMAGLSVVVLESEVAGFGASGRNASHPWFDVQRVSAVSHFPMLEAPAEVGSALEAFARRSVS